MRYTLKTIKFAAFLLLITFVYACNKKESSKEITHTKIYKEKHRPQLHFTPKANWMNDPNGMFYHEGKYHLFYQYYPDSTVWGPMHWGHAESKDLVHWKELPVALYPDSIGYIFSGGAVVDTHNTSKLGSKDNPPIVATFTHHDIAGEKAKTNDFQKQSIAYSVDGGYEWTKYKGNPVIPNSEKIKDFRDPKVVWHAASQKWIMALTAYDKVKFYESVNLRDWEFISDFGIKGDNRLWECPDLFPMQVEESNEIKWVLIVSIQKDAPNGGTATSYFVGDFDGKQYKSDIKAQKWLDYGTDNYAFVTWNNVPKVDGRVLGIGWMSNWEYAQVVPTEKWRSAMTLPRELKLINRDGDYYVYSLPVDEIKTLRADETTFDEMIINEKKVLEGVFDASQSEFEFAVDLKNTSAKSFAIQFENNLGENYTIDFNKEAGKMYVDRTHTNNTQFSDAFYKNVHSVPLGFDGNNLNIRIIMDASSSEIFINNGALSFTSIFFPTEKFDKVSLSAQNGSCTIANTKIYPLNGIWN